MPKVLVFQADPAASNQLQADMKPYGWAIDACEGMLEMLRLIEKNRYEAVIINMDYLKVEIYALLGAIRAFGKNPKILLNLPQSADGLPPALLALDYPVIKGALTTRKLLEAVPEML